MGRNPFGLLSLSAHEGSFRPTEAAGADYWDSFLSGSTAGDPVRWHYASPRREPVYLQSDPLALKEALRETLSGALGRCGLETVSVPTWDGKADSLSNIETDSVLVVDIKRFWGEGVSATLGRSTSTKMYMSIYLTMRLGVKREGRVFTSYVFGGKEMSLTQGVPERIEETMNQILGEGLDACFSSFQ
jgi:hypothetical protein